MVTKAIVLGAGGPTGVAWEVGLLAGLAEAGLDVSAADLVVGTSAGSLVGALVTSGANIEELFEHQLETSAPAVPPRTSAQPPQTSPTATPPTPTNTPTPPPAATTAAGVTDTSAAASGASRGAVLALAWLVLRYRDPERYRREVGKLALGARTMTEAQWRSNFEGRLPTQDWPRQKLLITAVDAASGEFVAFGRGDSASLVDAVAASTAVPGVWPPISIGGRRFMDGGMRSCTNADLAAGHDRVLILAPLPRGNGPLPSAFSQAAELRAAGAQVALVSPDKAARRAIGWNPMDWRRKAAAAQAGRVQAKTVAAKIAQTWFDAH